jgi:NAD(P)-dependent dehydrogenase (short-subunit alcohol dehydrogenase family)
MFPLILTGKSAIVTGATSGIGLAVAQSLARAGAFVIGVGRSAERNEAAGKQILEEAPDAHLAYLLADLSEQTQVRQLAVDIRSLLQQEGYSALDILVNNAGVYLARKTMTSDGIEMTFAVDHLAGFLLTHDLFPLLQNSGDPRVITMSSYAHKTTWMNLKRIADPRPYFSLLAYKRAKLCNVLFTQGLNRRFPQVKALAADPGLVNTGIASKGGKGISSWVWGWHRHQGVSPNVPAEKILRLVSDPDLDVSLGAYYKEGLPHTPSRNARDEKLGNRLWTLSCKLTGVDWD